MRDPQSKPTIIDEDGQRVVEATGAARGATGRGDLPFGMPGFGSTGVPPIPEHLLNRQGKPSLLKLIGPKGALVLALVAAGVISLAALSVMVLLFAIPVVALLAMIGWVVAKVRGPRSAPSTAARSVVVIRRRI